MKLLDIVHFYDYHPDVLVFLFCLHLGNVPVGWEEDDEFSRFWREEMRLFLHVIIADEVFLLIIGHRDRTRRMVEKGKTLRPSHHILEVYLLPMALGVAFLKRLILRVLHTRHKGCSWYGMFPRRDSQEVCGGKPLEEGIPLVRIFMVLAIKLLQIDRLVRACLSETVAPDATLHPFPRIFLRLDRHTDNQDGKGNE